MSQQPARYSAKQDVAYRNKDNDGYGDPSDVSWGSANNPEVYAKIWYDAGGRVDVNYFHVSVPDIEVYSDYLQDNNYDNKGTTITSDRYIRHEYIKKYFCNFEETDGDSGTITFEIEKSGYFLPQRHHAGSPYSYPAYRFSTFFCHGSGTVLPKVRITPVEAVWDDIAEVFYRF